jgi:hypothetical protein
VRGKEERDAERRSKEEKAVARWEEEGWRKRRQ